MSQYATRVTYIDSTSGAVELNGGDSVAIHNVLVQNTTTSDVDFTFTQGSVKGDITITVAVITVSGNTSNGEWNPCAIFDKGFRIAALSSGTSVTVSWRPGI